MSNIRGPPSLLLNLGEKMNNNNNLYKRKEERIDSPKFYIQ
jgi:hypothetical protein